MSEWIRIEDGLPETPEQGCTVVLVASYSNEREKYHICAGEFQRGYFYNRYGERMPIDDPYWPITHWMPLPEPPK